MINPVGYILLYFFICIWIVAYIENSKFQHTKHITTLLIVNFIALIWYELVQSCKG